MRKHSQKSAFQEPTDAINSCEGNLGNYTCTLLCALVTTRTSRVGNRWLCGNTLASDANGPGSTPGGTLELDTVEWHIQWQEEETEYMARVRNIYCYGISTYRLI